MAAVVTDGDKDSTDSFLCDGDEDGVTFKEATKQYTSISSYPPSSPSPSCWRVSLEAFSLGPACSVTQSVDNIVLPPVLVQLLLMAIPTTSGGTSFRLMVADTGATDHMVPNRGAFISYKFVQGLQVRMGVTIPLLLSWVMERRLSLSTANVFLSAMSLHVPGLRVPLYSLRGHLRQSGCSFLGSYETGMHVYFPGVVLTVDTSSDCHLSYESLGKTDTLSLLHYVQHWCPLVVYPTEHLAFLDQTSAQSCREHLLAFSSENLPEEPTPSPPESDPPSVQLPHLSSNPLLPSDSPPLLPTLSRDDITHLVHHEGSSLPPVRPCDRANGSDMKTHWTSEELHCALGCRRFRNYKHILQTSLNAQWIDGGEFSTGSWLLCSYPEGKTWRRN